MSIDFLIEMKDEVKINPSRKRTFSFDSKQNFNGLEFSVLFVKAMHNRENDRRQVPFIFKRIVLICASNNFQKDKYAKIKVIEEPPKLYLNTVDSYNRSIKNGRIFFSKITIKRHETF